MQAMPKMNSRPMKINHNFIQDLHVVHLPMVLKTLLLILFQENQLVNLI